jgi:DNA-binding IscR family transcriptional regulator
MLEAGRCCPIAKIAEAEKINRSFVSRLLQLILLAPDI